MNGQYFQKIRIVLVLAFAFLIMYSCSNNGNERDEYEPEDENPPSNTEQDRLKVIRLDFVNEYNSSGEDKGPVFDRYLPQLGLDWMLGYLEGVNPKCHSEAHELGRLYYEQVRDVGTALMDCGKRCTSACMHGVLMGAFGGGDLEDIKQKMSEFCYSDSMSGLHKPGNCAHGIGHALMAVTDNEVNRALSSCDMFKDSAMVYYCATGVFMEYLDTGKKEDYINRPTHYPCDELTRYPAACYRYKMPSMLQKYDGNIEALKAECLSLPSPLRRGCFHGLGNASIPLVFEDSGMIRKVCNRGSAEDRILCIEGVTEKLADYDQNKALEACSYLEGEYFRLCESAARGKMYRLDKETMTLYIGKN